METALTQGEKSVQQATKGRTASTNYLLYVLYFWMLLVNIPNVQVVYAPYGQFFVREIVTLLVILLVGWRMLRHGVKSPALFVLFCLIAANTVIIALASQPLDLSIRVKLMVRILILASSVIVIPNLVRYPTDVRKVFLFTMFMNAVIALTAPMQDITGVIPELYPYPNWPVTNSRGFLMRYVSLLGDPNVGGMIGGLLPITLLAISRKHYRFWSIAIIAWSVLLVVYSQSLTGTLFFVLSTLSIWLFRKSLLSTYVVLMSLVLMLFLSVLWSSPGVVNTAWEQITGVIRLYTSERFSYPLERPGILPSPNLMMADLDFRFFAYLDRNDSLEKVLFGSTYSLVTPSAEYNPFGITPHNSYKEMYLAGGLLQLGLYLLMFGMTFGKGLMLVINKRSYAGLRGTATGAFLIFSILLLGLGTFPVYHYSGVGQILWMSVSVVNIVYDRLRSIDHRPDRISLN